MWEPYSWLLSWATGAELLLESHTGSGPAAVRKGRPARAHPWASTAVQQWTAPGASDAVLLGCLMRAVGDEAAWDTSFRYSDPQRPAWPRPRFRLSAVVRRLMATRPWTGAEIEDVHRLLPDTDRRRERRRERVLECCCGSRARREVGQAGRCRCIVVLTPSQDRRPIDPSRGERSDTRANVKGPRAEAIAEQRARRRCRGGKSATSAPAKSCSVWPSQVDARRARQQQHRRQRQRHRSTTTPTSAPHRKGNQMRRASKKRLDQPGDKKQSILNEACCAAEGGGMGRGGRGKS